jgi:hypothetical protein
LNALDFGHDIIQVIEAFYLRAKCCWSWAACGAGDEIKASFIFLSGIKADAAGDDDDACFRALVGI